MIGAYMSHRNAGGDVDSFIDIFTGLTDVPQQYEYIRNFVMPKAFGTLESEDTEAMMDLLKRGQIEQFWDNYEMNVLSGYGKTNQEGADALNSQRGVDEYQGIIEEWEKIVSTMKGKKMKITVDGEEREIDILGDFASIDETVKYLRSLNSEEERELANRLQTLGARVALTVQPTYFGQAGGEALMKSFVPTLDESPGAWHGKLYGAREALIDRNNSFRAAVNLPEFEGAEVERGNRIKVYDAMAQSKYDQSPEAYFDSVESFRSEFFNFDDENVAETRIADFTPIEDNLIENLEGFRAEAYPDQFNPDGTQRYSIGFGTKAEKGDVITEEEARKAKEEFIADSSKVIQNTFKRKFNDRQTEALQSFVYNLGTGIFATPEGKALVKAIEDNDTEEIKRQWVLYNTAKNAQGESIYMPGLEKRRRQELDYFFREND
jgi:lysozyme